MNSGSYRFHVGSFECFALSDGRFNYPLESFFSNVPIEEVQAALHQRNLPVNQVVTPYTCLLINTGDHRVLIDTGAGNLGTLAAKIFPTVDHSTTLTGTLVKNLQATGFQPDDIDTIIISHAHPDHIGGTIDSNGALTFANAKYFIHHDEWLFWTSEAAEEMAPSNLVQFARQYLEPLASRLTYIKDVTEIIDGIQSIPTPGHTPGHIAVSVSSAGEKLLHIADVVLYPLHLEFPNWKPVFDIDPVRAAASKRKIFDQAAAENTMVFAHHFPPFPNLGYVLKQGDAWRWQPLEIEG